MSNRSKSRGTMFETACVRYLREALGDTRIERRALHGSRDMGDVYGLRAHGSEGIVECKNYKSWSRSDLLRWQAQTVAERGNADADFALLVVHRKGVGAKTFGENHCHMQVRDLVAISGGDFACLAGDTVLDTWVMTSLADACRLMTWGEA